MAAASTTTDAATPAPAGRPSDGTAAQERAARAAASVWPIVIGALVVSAVSLLAPSTITYDPTSWVIWGREIAHWDLVTTGGPSWKPLPVLFTIPFSLFGDSAPLLLWAWIARAGALAGMAMGYRLARRMGGPVAGGVAALAILASEGYAYGAWRGNSEGLMVAFALLAVERHLDGRRTAAFVLAGAAALIRPEIWPLWGAYGLWLLWRRRDAATALLVLGGGGLVLMAWFLPEYLGSGDALRAASRALDPNLDSAAFASFPALEVLRRTLVDAPVVVVVGALLAVGFALKRREGAHDRVVLVLAAAAGALLLAVAAMTQAGFSGNQRYVVLPLAFVAVLAGAGWVELVLLARSRSRPLLAAGALALFVAGCGLYAAGEAEVWDRQVTRAGLEVESNRTLATAIAQGGGRTRIDRCPAVYATRFEVPIVAWTLHRHLNRTQIFAVPPGAAIGLRGSALSRDPRFAETAVTRRWVVRHSGC